MFFDIYFSVGNKLLGLYNSTLNATRRYFEFLGFSSFAALALAKFVTGIVPFSVVGGLAFGLFGILGGFLVGLVVPVIASIVDYDLNGH